MFTFNFILEYSKKGFGIKLGSIWYGFRLQRAKISEKQSKELLDELVKIENDMAKPRFQMSNDSNTIYTGFMRIWWRQKSTIQTDVVEPYTRESKLEQKAQHYDDYKNRDERWDDRR